MTFLENHSNLLNRRPMVVGVMTAKVINGDSFKFNLNKNKSADILELRLDSFDFVYGATKSAILLSKFIIRKIRKNSRLPLLLTLRSYKESGINLPQDKRLRNDKRIEILSALIPFVDLVDLEIKEIDFTRRMTALAHKNRVGVIHSTHDFIQNGSANEIRALVKKSLQLKGDIFKVAVTPGNENDVFDFLNFGSKLGHPRPVLIAMGKYGAPSRAIGYSFGSVLTYGHFGQAVAPGQFSSPELLGFVKKTFL